MFLLLSGLITILGTNDIHGGVEASISKDHKRLGGMSLWGGIVQATREGLHHQFGNEAGVLVVDAGDQFQGTLISNYNEGDLVFSTMKLLGYDAVIPGNHGYDFGPLGWLVDQSSDPSKRREALERNLFRNPIPLISANTFLLGGDEQQPFFLKPYIIKNIAGVRVALIGIDHHDTHKMTTLDNVADLRFGDEEESYRRIRRQLQDKADVFVMVIHNGNSSSDKSLSKLIEKLTVPERLVDAVVSGHTHTTYNERINEVPLIQSGSGGSAFGRIDLVWDAQKKQIDRSKTRSFAGIRLLEKECEVPFCTVNTDGISYEGVAVHPNFQIEQLIRDARMAVAPIASKPIGKAPKEVKRDYIQENALANILTDSYRRISGADIAMLNGGGIRDNFPARDLTYEDFFKVIPFSNHALVIGPMKTANLISLIKRSIETCGTYGALFQSGLRVTFKRDCKNPKDIKLLHVETLDGKIVYEDSVGITKNAPTEFNIATIDFLATGGSDFEGFKGTPMLRDLGLFRELLVEDFFQKQPIFSSETDGRWKNVSANTPIMQDTRLFNGR